MTARLRVLLAGQEGWRTRVSRNAAGREDTIWRTRGWTPDRLRAQVSLAAVFFNRLGRKNQQEGSRHFGGRAAGGSAG